MEAAYATTFIPSDGRFLDSFIVVGRISKALHLGVFACLERYNTDRERELRRMQAVAGSVLCVCVGVDSDGVGKRSKTAKKIRIPTLNVDLLGVSESHPSTICVFHHPSDPSSSPSSPHYSHLPTRSSLLTPPADVGSQQLTRLTE